MSGIFGSGKTDQTPIAYTGININTAVRYLPVPVLLGYGRLGINLIDYLDFTSKAQSGSGGGKGGGNTTTGYKYSATLVMGLCEGEVGANTGALIWKEKALVSLSSEGMSLFRGTVGQAPWSYLTANHPDHAFTYSETAYAAVANYDLQSSPDTPNMNILTYGPLWGSGITCRMSYLPPYHVPALGDADPVLAAKEILNNQQWGVPDFPESVIDTASWLFSAAATTTGDAAWQTYCSASGIAVSVLMNDQEAASDILARLAQLTNTALFWSEGRLKAVPYGDSALTANGYHFVPNVTPVYDLSDADYVRQSKKDPIEIDRVDPADVYNCYRLEWSNCYLGFVAQPIEDKEQHLVEDHGLRVAPTIQAHEITHPKVAQTVVNLIKQRGCYILRTFKFKLSAEYFLLEPMDLVTLTDTDLGLSQVAVRITKIEEDDKGEFTITAEEFPAGVATTALYATETDVPTPVDTGVAAKLVNPPVILEPPANLASNGGAEVWIAASGGAGGEADPYWGGCQVWLSLDDISYEQIGTIEAPARQGVLTAPLAAFAGTNPDDADTLSVNLNESGGQLTSATTGDAAAGRTLCWVDGELLNFATATLTSITVNVSEAQIVALSADLSSGAITVENAATFLADGGVGYTGGAALTKVASNPAAGQYTVDAGVYGFNGADTQADVTIAYSFTGPGYDLTGLVRGYGGTEPGAHATGAQFVRLDGAVFKYPLAQEYVGQMLYLKLVSFNAWGNGLEDISTVEPLTYVPVGTGYTIAPPT
jgi:hypothetical protein